MLNQVELLILNKDFERIKVIKDFTSLQWTERYFSPGDFELHCGIRHMDELMNGAYVYRKDKKSLACIEHKRVVSDEYDVILKGRFAESILENRVINTTTAYSGNTEDVCRDIVADFCLTGDRSIPKLTLGIYNGLGTTVISQHTGRTVLDALTSILTEQEMSYRINFDANTSILSFEVYQGLDRTQSQSVNDWCVFSSDFYNVIKETYETINDLKNFAYVIGGDERVITVDRTAGGERRELWVDAKDINTRDFSETEYLQALRDRGNEKLAEYNITDFVECEIGISSTTAFQIGDKCTYKQPNIGIIAEGRITEIYEVIENSNISTSITLGKEQLTIVQKIKRGFA